MSISAKLSIVNYPVLIGSLFLLSVVQAYFVNIVNMDLHLLPALIMLLGSAMLLTLFTSTRYLLNLPAFPIFILTCLLSITFLAGLSGVDNFREFIYQAYALILALFVIIFLSTYDLRFEKSVYLKYIVYVYAALSVIMHFFYWEYFADIFYDIRPNYGGLMMDGEYKRLYGLLYNPLANSFLFFLFIVIAHFYRIGSYPFYAVCSLMVMLSLSRSVILVFLLWVLVVSLYERRYLLFFFLVSVVLVALSISPQILSKLIDLVLLKDSTGSAVEHVRNYSIGLQSMMSFVGNGYPAGVIEGAANERLESWPFQVAYSIGIFSLLIIFLIIWAIWLAYRRHGFIGLVSSSIFVPVAFSFPLHTFNLPMLMFLLTLFVGLTRRPVPNLHRAIN